jgi:phosphatidylglycerophosphate synthase
MMKTILWTVTLLRVVLIPVFLWLALTAQELGRSGGAGEGWRLGALATLLVMGLSDVVDGWIARRYELATQIGAVVDAGADKLVQVTLVAFFVFSVGPAFRSIPLWFLIVLFGRDLVLLVGVSMLRARYGPIDVEHRWHGRTTSLLVHVVLFWAALRLPGGPMTVLMGATAALAVFSATVYALDGIAQGRAKAEGPQ